MEAHPRSARNERIRLFLQRSIW